ncbi:MAG: hypothetical protein WBC33_08925, partial [Conexibacter sp.]
MRTRKAFIAGVGTTGALVAATICTFLIVSAIVAFEGWPSLHLSRDAATVAERESRELAAAVGGVSASHAGVRAASRAARPAQGTVDGSGSAVAGDAPGQLPGVGGQPGSGTATATAPAG